jgi:hypothetical protein
MLIRLQIVARLLCLLLAAPVSGRAADHPQFIKFRPIIVSTFADTRVSGLWMVTVQVQATDYAARKRLEQARPKLQDAFTCAAVELGQLYISPSRKINFQLVTKRMQAAAQTAMPGEKLRVLIVDASSRAV